MKLTTSFTIINGKLNQMDLIRDAMNRRKLATERLHEDYRKIYKNHQFAYHLNVLLNEKVQAHQLHH